jgi:cell wall-active antibiotic response 4TMS protein YvqF
LEVTNDRHETVSTEVLLGAILVLIGAVLLLDRLDLVELRDMAKLWPVSLIGVGIYQLLEHNEKSQVR